MSGKRKDTGFILMILMAAVSGTLLAGCGDKNEEIQRPEVETIAVEEEVSTITAEKTEQSEKTTEEKATEEKAEVCDKENETAVGEEEQTFVYIGTKSAGFEKYPVDVKSNIDGNELIAAMAELTGWNLTLADDVCSGKGGVSVTFSSECALVTGPPTEQKEKFFVYDSYQLAQTVLDSIQETIRQNFVQAPGNPDDLDIWFSMEDGPIEIEDLTVSLYQPWDEQDIFD